MTALSIVLGALLVSGCVRVKPWQREQLAKPSMQIEGSAAERSFDRVIEKSSYEGKMGGGTTEGAGCGCN